MIDCEKSRAARRHRHACIRHGDECRLVGELPAQVQHVRVVMLAGGDGFLNRPDVCRAGFKFKKSSLQTANSGEINDAV